MKLKASVVIPIIIFIVAIVGGTGYYIVNAYHAYDKIFITYAKAHFNYASAHLYYAEANAYHDEPESVIRNLENSVKNLIDAENNLNRAHNQDFAAQIEQVKLDVEDMLRQYTGTKDNEVLLKSVYKLRSSKLFIDLEALVKHRAGDD